MTVQSALDTMPLIAILRGITPEEAVPACTALAEAGIKVMEIPLNSPRPFESIELVAKTLGNDVVVGAGTVLHVDEVAQLRDAGGQVCVSPNVDTAVIKASLDAGMEPFPGFMTPTEALQAWAAGARHLKLFPAGPLGLGHFKAINAILPKQAKVYAVGGVSDKDMATWMRGGIAGFGMGTALYKPGDSVADIAARARASVAAFHAENAAA